VCKNCIFVCVDRFWKVKGQCCLWGGGWSDFIARPGSHVITFSVGRFMCKERVMLIEREIRLLFCVNKWCFVSYKQVMRQSS